MRTSEIISQYYSAFNQKDYEGMLALLADDVVHDINQGKRMSGKDSFRKFLQRMNELYDENLTEIKIMTDEEGQHAGAEFICNGIYKSTDEGLPSARGQSYRIPVGCFFEVQDGKIKRVSNHYNLNDWVEMVK